MTPAERLIAAADLLEQRAEGAIKGPWRSGDGAVWSEADVEDGVVLTDSGRALPGDAAYIATMHPEVGKALAALLRWEADAVAFNDGRCALAITDLILAGAS